MHYVNDSIRQVISGVSFQSPDDSPKLKFRQEVGCLELSKHVYLCRKDFTVLAKTVDNFNTNFPCNTHPAKVLKPNAKRVSDNSSSDHISERHVHSHSISNTKIDSTIQPASINNSVLLTPNHASPTPTSIE